MSLGLVSTDERACLNQDDAGLILTSGAAALSNHGFADWFRQLRFEGWTTFRESPLPARTDEAWRFASVKALDIAPYHRSRTLSEPERAELINRSGGLSEVAGRMIFGNDQLLKREVRSDSLRSQGVIFAPIEQAVAEHAELFREHFMTQEVVLGSKKFAALHKAWVTSGTFLYIPRNVEIELPIEVFHWLHGAGGSTFPHTLLIAGENSKVTLIDYFESTDDTAPGFSCGVNDLFLEAGARLTYVNVQNWSRTALALQMNSTVVGRDAHAVSMNLNLGGNYARTESVSRLIGEGGRSDMLAVSVADGSQEFDQRTLQDHKKPHTASDLLYKNSLTDTARTIFAGLIRVEPKAHKTDAYQKVRNLLLSDDAEANSMPGLEILADDVRCTHGATSGQIDEEELFYMLSRGLKADAARQLIVSGFLNEVFERLGHEAIAGKLDALVQAKFAARAHS